MPSPEPLTRTLPRAAWILIAAVMCALWFAGLGSRALVGPDEGRYAEIAREMTVTGDYVTPRLNGLKYFEKPPLQYWVTAAAFNVFGVEEWSSRLAPALGGLLAVAAVGIALRRLASPLAGAFGAIVMGSCVMSVVISHFTTLDAFLTGWMALALCGFVRAQEAGIARTVQRNWMLLAYAALAAATLTKGPVALIIAGGAMVFYTLATRDLGPWKRLHLVPGVLLYLVLTVPWFVLVSRANTEFAHFFFIHEHVERFLTTEHKRTGAWYYFVPIYGFGLLPWLFVWLATCVRSWRDTLPSGNGFDWMRFCMAWAVFIFVFFSASGSKLPSYIYPEFPAIAMLLGYELTRASPRLLWLAALAHAFISVVFLLCMLFGYTALVPSISSPETPAALYLAFGPWLKAAAVIFVLGSCTALYFFRQPGNAARTFGVLALAACGLVGFQVAFLGHESFRSVRSSFDLLQDADRGPEGRIDRSLPIFQVGTYEQTFPFYLGRTTTIVNYRDELALGLDAEPEKAYKNFDAWIPVWTALPQGYALMQHETYDYLVKLGVPMQVLSRDPRRVLVARH